MQSRRIYWFGHSERMDMSVWVSKYRAVEVEGSVTRCRPWQAWDKVIRRDLREKRVSKDLAKDKSAWKRVTY